MITYILIFTLTAWLSALTYYYLRLKKNYSTFTQGSHHKSLDELLSTIVRGEHSIKDDIAKLKARCDKIEKDVGFHIQKIGLRDLILLKIPAAIKVLFLPCWMLMILASLLQRCIREWEHDGILSELFTERVPSMNCLKKKKKFLRRLLIYINV